MSRTALNEFKREIGPIKAKCYFPGFSYDDFDRKGRISAWKMSKLFEGGRLLNLHNGFLKDSFKISKHEGIFLIAQHIQLKSNSNRYRTCPFSVSFDMISIGTSAGTFRQQIVNENNQQVIAICDSKLVHISRETRRPIPLSHVVRDHLSKLLGKTDIQPSFPQKIPDLPLDTFHIPIFILHSATDVNGHLNQAHCLRYCMDCAAMASTAGHYINFTDDILNYQAIEIGVLYKREGLAGDLVHVHTWQEKEYPQDLHFIITKDKNALLYCKIKFALKPLSNL